MLGTKNASTRHTKNKTDHYSNNKEIAHTMPRSAHLKKKQKKPRMPMHHSTSAGQNNKRGQNEKISTNLDIPSDG